MNKKTPLEIAEAMKAHGKKYGFPATKKKGKSNTNAKK